MKSSGVSSYNHQTNKQNFYTITNEQGPILMTEA